MTLSIRTRLLVWVIGGMILLETVFAVVTFQVLSSALVRSFDAVLASTARTLQGTLEQAAGEVKVDFAETDLSDFRRAERPSYFQMWLDDGQPLASSAAGGSAGLSAFSGPNGALTVRPVVLPGGRAGRAAGLRVVPVRDDEGGATAGQRSVTLVVARGTEDLDAQLTLLWWLLTAGAGAGILLSCGVGALAVRQGLRPLDSLARRIAGIGHDDLGTEIPAGRMPAELSPLVDRLNGLLGRLQQAFGRERTFASDVAHELRTPLAGMRSTLELALSRPRGQAEYRDALEKSLEIVLRTQGLVETLLELARLERGRSAARLEPIGLADVVDAAWRPLEGRAEVRRLSAERHVPRDLVVHGDPSALALALGAVLANAVDHADVGGHVAIVAVRDGDAVRLEIANSGSTLAPDDVAHVFERFWRGDAARAHTGVHHGLGLSLAKRAVEASGGTMSAGVSGGTFTLRVSLRGESSAPG